MELKMNIKRNIFHTTIICIKNLYFYYLASTNYKIYIFIYHRVQFKLLKNNFLYKL